jgi:cytochrome c-type biogenesis protein CcmE
MRKPKTKFLVGGGIIVAVLVWLALAGARESKTYYMTSAELQTADSAAFGKRLRVAGDVVDDSIRRDGRKSYSN